MRPGCWCSPASIDVHTHTRVASDAEPDRFFQDSVAAAFGGTTTFLAFNNPGTGSSPAAERSLLTGVREWRAATDGDSAIDVGLSLGVSGHADDPLAELPATIDAGIATSKAFMVYDFRLPDESLLAAMGVMGRRGGMLQVHCEDPVLLEAGIAAALARGETAPRFHASSRPPHVEAVATARAMDFAARADAPVHVVHLSSAAALAEVRIAKAAGVRVTAETCPHYLVLTEERYEEPDPTRCACFVISPPLRSAADRDAHVGRPGRRLAGPGRDRSRAGSDGPREGRGRSRRLVRPDQQRGARHRDAADARLLARASPRAGSPSSAWSTSSRPPQPGGSASTSKGSLEVGRDADIVLFDPIARRTVRAADLHHTSDYTPYEGLDVSGVGPRCVRARRGGHPRRRLRRPPGRRHVRRARPDRRLTTARRDRPRELRRCLVHP